MKKEDYIKAVRSHIDQAVLTNLNLENKKVVEAWLDKQIVDSYDKTQQIMKEDVRIKSAVMLFKKRLTLLQTLINILSQYELMDKQGLLSSLLTIM